MGEMALHLFRGCNMTTRIMTNQHLGSCLATERTRFFISRFVYVSQGSYIFSFHSNLTSLLRLDELLRQRLLDESRHLTLENFFCKIDELTYDS